MTDTCARTTSLRERVLLRNGRVVEVEYRRRRATETEIVDDDKYGVVRATRQVILCTGAISSPALLTVSGVGNRDPMTARTWWERRSNEIADRHFPDRSCQLLRLPCCARSSNRPTSRRSTSGT